VGTVLVVLAVLAIATAALVDSFLGDDGAESAAPQEPAAAATTPAEPPADGESGPGGTLYYTDETCTLKAVRLPSLRSADAPNWSECRFVLSPDGFRASAEGSGWDPHGDPRRRQVFQSEDGTIQIGTNAGPESERFEGTAPAYRPDGTLTYFADGAVRTWPDGNVVLSQRDLVRALRGPFPELAVRDNRLRAREAAWLDDRRLAAIFSAQGPQLGEITGGSSSDMLAIYDGTELNEFTFDGAGGLSDLRVSHGGRYAAAKSNGGRDAPGGFVWLESGLGEQNTPRIKGYRALALSPDDRWYAVASDDGVFVYRHGYPWEPELELDIDAQDLEWRAEQPSG
jgi:hypothetical protein